MKGNKVTTGIAIACAIGSAGFATIQLVNTFQSQPGVVQTTSTSGEKPNAVAESQPVPHLSVDPFASLQATVASANSPSGDATMGTNGSSATTDPMSVPPAMPGGTIRMPSDPTFSGTQSGTASSQSVQTLPAPTANQTTEQAAEGASNRAPSTRPRVALRGVIATDSKTAYLQINGRRARAFTKGSTLGPGVTLTEIQPNAIQIQVHNKNVRLRVGQEVEL